jgi:protein-L-isoaspartate O-methyltransferase
MNLREISKGIIIRFASERLYQNIRKLHYLHKFKSYARNRADEDVDQELSIFKYLIKPGDSVVDVGANFGFVTSYLSRLVGERGCVYT